jgi:hypothetical protein
MVGVVFSLWYQLFIETITGPIITPQYKCLLLMLLSYLTRTWKIFVCVIV